MGLLVDLTQPSQISELEEVMGNLLCLFSVAADLHRKASLKSRTGPMPHQIDPSTFHACWTVLNEQDFALAQHCIDVLFTIYLPEGNAASWYPDRDDASVPRNSRARKRKGAAS